jgi:hypothetical protein
MARVSCQRGSRFLCSHNLSQKSLMCLFNVDDVCLFNVDDVCLFKMDDVCLFNVDDVCLFKVKTSLKC